MLTIVDQDDNSNETRQVVGAGRSLLDEIVRDGARQMLAAALQAEVADYIARHAGEIDDNGHRLVVRNGYHAEREVVTAAGAVAVKAPRVNDKRVDPDTGERRRFSSAILPAWARKSAQVSEVLPLLYLHGLSTSDFGPALEQFLGTGAGLSASSITRLTTQWQDEAKAFARRDLSPADYVYLWVDGIHLKVRLEFFRYPAEHWVHLRTTNPIESTFATVRLRTKVTKGPGSRAAGIAMAYKLIEAAQARWRAVNAPHLVALVRAGALFHKGKLLERPVEITPEPSPDTPASEVA